MLVEPRYPALDANCTTSASTTEITASIASSPATQETTSTTTSVINASTSVKKVISELEATFGLKNKPSQSQQQAQSTSTQTFVAKIAIPSSFDATKPLSSSSLHPVHPTTTTTAQQRTFFKTGQFTYASLKSDAKTQTDREVTESVSPTPPPKVPILLSHPTPLLLTSRKSHPTNPPAAPVGVMESDSSTPSNDRQPHQSSAHPNRHLGHISYAGEGHHHRLIHSHHQEATHNVKKVPPLTTVSVSTCPSCGSENVSSESSAKRSASFQHLLHSKTSHHACSQNMPPRVTNKSFPSSGDTVYRSKSFNYGLYPSNSGPSAVVEERDPLPVSCSFLRYDCCDCDREVRRKFVHPKNKRIRRKKTDRLYSRRLPTSSTDPYLSLYPNTNRRYVHMKASPRLSCCSGCNNNSSGSSGGAFRYEPLDPFQLQRSHANLIERSRSFHFPTSNGHLINNKRIGNSHNHFGGKLNNYRFWDLDEWRAQVRREKARRKERRALLMVSIVGIIVFICVSYFGTLLFLRITRLP